MTLSPLTRHGSSTTCAQSSLSLETSSSQLLALVLPGACLHSSGRRARQASRHLWSLSSLNRSLQVAEKYVSQIADLHERLAAARATQCHDIAIQVRAFHVPECALTLRQALVELQDAAALRRYRDTVARWPELLFQIDRVLRDPTLAWVAAS